MTTEKLEGTGTEDAAIIAARNTENLNKAMSELDDLQKSADDVKDDDLEQLTKSLEDELGTSLTKSMDTVVDDAGTAGKGEAIDLDEEFKKSQEEAYDEELVKASDAFASLEKSTKDMFFALADRVESLTKAVAAGLNLNIKQAKVIASLAKSRDEDSETMKKSMILLGGKPMAPNAAMLGLGTSVIVEELTKSISEVSDALTKAVQSGLVDSRHLSIWGTYKDVGRLPDDVKKIIGL